MRGTKAFPIAVVGIVALGLTVGVAPVAFAATKPLPKKTLRSYSWDGYRAVVKPTGSVGPGRQVLSAVVTVTSAGKVKAKGVRSYRAKPGTYRAVSKFRYRAATPYAATRNVTATVPADSCVVTSVVPDGAQYAYYTGSCVGEAFDNSNLETYTGTFTASWHGYRLEGEDVGTTMQYPVLKVEGGWVMGSITYTLPYTAYRYGNAQTLVTKRTLVVRKVTNTPVMTRHEWDVLDYGDSVYRVRRVVGSSGTLVYTGSLGDAYKWRNSSGSWTYIWFDDDGANKFDWFG